MTHIYSHNPKCQKDQNTHLLNLILAQSPLLQQTLVTYLIPTVRFAGHGDGEVELVQGGDVGGYDGHHVSSLDAE
jgi:hypothetical protein